MKNSFYGRLLLLAIIVFVVSRGVLSTQFIRWGILQSLAMGANLLLAGVTALSFYFNQKAIHAQNHQAFVRLVYVSVFSKLLLCLIGVFVYVYANDGQVNKPSLFLFLLLYVLYTATETISLFQLTKTRSR